MVELWLDFMEITFFSFLKIQCDCEWDDINIARRWGEELAKLGGKRGEKLIGPNMPAWLWRAVTTRTDNTPIG